MGSNKLFCYLETMVRQYKSSQILVAFQAFNNITTHKLLIYCHGVVLDDYSHQTNNNFEKLLKQENAKNTSKVATSILVTIDMYIWLSYLLEVGPLNAKYDLERKLHERCSSANWGHDDNIERALATDNIGDDDEENL